MSTTTRTIWLMSTLFTFGGGGGLSSSTTTTKTSFVYGNEVAFICHHDNFNTRQTTTTTTHHFSSLSRNFALYPHHHPSRSSYSSIDTTTTTTAAFHPWRTLHLQHRKRRRRSTTTTTSTSLPVFFQNREESTTEPTEEDPMSSSSSQSSPPPPLSVSSAGEDISYSSPHSLPPPPPPPPRPPSKRRRLQQKLNQSNTALFALFKRFNPRAATTVATTNEEDTTTTTTTTMWKDGGDEKNNNDNDDDDEGCLVLEHAPTGKTESICFDDIQNIHRGGSSGGLSNGYDDRSNNGIKQSNNVEEEEEEYHANGSSLQLLENELEKYDNNDDNEEEQQEEERTDEMKMEFDNVPAIPSYKLPPEFIPLLNTNDDDDDDDDDKSELIHHHDDVMEEETKTRKTWLTQETTTKNKNEINHQNKDHKEEEEEINNNSSTKTKKKSKKETKSQVNRGIIVMDNFSPYHGQYISRMARKAYNAGVVSVLSNYITGYLYQECGLTDHLSMRLPPSNDDEHIEEWVTSIPFEVVGVVCESDSGLEDAEKLGEMLGLYPDRHDGYNLARRNKYLMMEVMKEYGLQNVVEQRLCGSLEEAVEFAMELGVTDDDYYYVHVDDTIDYDNHDDEETDYNDITKSEYVSKRNENNGESSFVTIKEEKNENELLDEMEKEEIQEQIIQQKSIQKENKLMESIMDDTDDDDHDDHEDDAVKQLGFTTTEKDNVDNDNYEEKEEKHKSNSGVLGLPKTHHPSNKPKTYCVVKPTRGVASDDVHLCPNLQSVSKAFTKIHHSTVFGTMNNEKHDSVLLQEFASGTEYAVDIVSKGGQHKVAALWKYDKRSVNGAPFVYHATELVDADTRVGRAVCEYAMEALDALNVHWGMSHTEIIVEEEEEEGGGDDDDDEKIRPRLVEVNCRQHNTDFAPLTTAAVGYNALDMLLSAYLGDADDFPPHTEHMRLIWNDLPDLPVTRAYGAIVHLVSHVEGIIEEVNYDALEEIESMDSVMAMEVYQRFLSVGNEIEKTVDIRTDTGWVHIMNNDEEQFLKDYNRILELAENMFVVEKVNGEVAGADIEMKINCESVNGAYVASSSPENTNYDDDHETKMNEEAGPIAAFDLDKQNE